MQTHSMCPQCHTQTYTHIHMCAQAYIDRYYLTALVTIRNDDVYYDCACVHCVANVCIKPDGFQGLVWFPGLDPRFGLNHWFAKLV
jgi:hypothetical protein